MSTTEGAGRGFGPEVLEASGFPTISFDSLVVGERFRSDDLHVKPLDVEAYAFAVGDHDPWFFEPGPFGGPVAHPTILANQALFLRHNRYLVPAGLHARMVFAFHTPIPLGTRARSTGELLEKYWRRNKPYMVTGWETRAADGTLLVSGHFVQMLLPGTAPPSGTAPRPEPDPPVFDPAIGSATGRSGTLKVGQQLEPVVRTISQRQIDCYSGVRPRSIHTDPDWARTKGFPATIAQGMMSTAYVSAVMTGVIGAGFVAGGTMDVRFLQPVLCGDTVTISARVVGFTRDVDGRIRAHVEVAGRNQRNGATMAGSASGVVGR